MLRAAGAASFDDLLADIPQSLRLGRRLDLPEPLSEMEARAHLKRLAGLNASAEGHICFLGGGAYDHYVPSIVDEIASRAEFYTAYTPYQPEISQGTLQAIYEYQSLITRLTGMEISNASLYDGGTALAEAVLMAGAMNGRKEAVISGCLNPMRMAILKTYLKATGITLKVTGRRNGLTDPDEVRSLVSRSTSCVVVDSPNFFGVVEDCAAIGEMAGSQGAVFIMAADPMSLGVLASPGECGADIVVGEGQGLGNYLNFGGPYLGFMAAKREHIRRLPGRIVGKTMDSRGRTCYCLTLQTREQHIRREKATSNICTNEALVALRAAVYLCWLGLEGIKEVGELCLAKAVYAGQAFASRGLHLEFKAPFFKEFAVRLPFDAAGAARMLAGKRILAGIPLGRFYPDLSNCLLVSFTEKRTRAEIDLLVDSLAEMVLRREA
jgi:glycine dehydrogenase subunit 1